MHAKIALRGVIRIEILLKGLRRNLNLMQLLFFQFSCKRITPILKGTVIGITDKECENEERSSFIQKRDNVGASTEPYGTPATIIDSDRYALVGQVAHDSRT